MNQMVKEIGKKVVALVPTKLWLSYRFKLRMGYPMDWKNPKTFNQKLQWLKVYDRKTKYITMVDKYEAKKYVAGIIGEEYIIPTLGVWKNFDEIDFDLLPNQFVLKCTHDSGGLVICRDKSKFDKKATKKKISKCMKTNYYWPSREWPYKNVKPRIIAEKYMDDENEAKGLTDYKFFSYNGEVKMAYISQGLEDHETASISFYDVNGERMPFYREDYQPIKEGFEIPANFDEMLDIADKLVKEISSSFVRVDLYSIKGKVYFSEITFFPCSGMIPFYPKEWDAILGGWITLPQRTP